jgi:hypothetical protein
MWGKIAVFMNSKAAWMCDKTCALQGLNMGINTTLVVVILMCVLEC